MSFRDRIVALEYHNAADLAAHPKQWKAHSRTQTSALRGVLNDIGIAGTLIAYRSERNGGKLTLIDGHLRSDAAPQKWPVLILDVSDDEADYLLATYDPLVSLVAADAEKMADLLRSVQAESDAVKEMLEQMLAETEMSAIRQVESDPQINMSKSSEQLIKIMLYSNQVALFEQALRLTGKRGRNEALIEVCKFYLEHHDKERQLDAALEGVTETESAA